jgi:hypothetical protein
VRLGDGRFVGLHRGAETLVLLDAALSAVGAPVPTPARPEAIALTTAGEVLVASGAGPTLAAFQVDGSVIKRREDRDRAVPGVSSVRAVAGGSNECIHALSEREDLLVSMCSDKTVSAATPPGPFRLEVTSGHVVVLSLIGHSIAAAPLGEDGLPSGNLAAVAHDGPFFGISAREAHGRLLVAAGGVEDAPLDRTGGFFGNVDSFVWLYAFERGGWKRVAEVSASEHGVVMPKAVGLRVAGRQATILAAGYATETALEIVVPLEGEGSTRARAAAGAPGIVRFIDAGNDRWVGPSMLLDAWVESGGAVHPAGEEPVRDEVFLGEALFSTTLMAPWQSSEGSKSRFTCETCHFEGGVDGRTHRTGRGDVVATTKPLRGLFNNAPHFTRALDEDTTEMVFAEFGVAAAASGHDGWFSLDEAPLAWTKRVAWDPAVDRSPLGLRRALVGYLAHAAHPPNPHVAGRSTFTADERRGAEVFRDDCAGCHAARLVTSDPATEVPADRWETLVLSDAGPIVWARDGYEKTGIEPYVHPDGARPTSLRRLEDKRPYFTNGSAKTLKEVVEGARWDEGGRFFHAGAPAGARALSPPDRAALSAFLRLL